MFLITDQSSASTPRANPTPRTAPTNVWVVDIGNPVELAKTTVDAAARLAANPRLGRNSVIFSPTVRMTRTRMSPDRPRSLSRL